MVGKNNFKQHMVSKGNKKQRFTIRKLSSGVASVSVGAMLLIPNGALSVSAEEASVASVEEEIGLVEVENPVEAEVADEQQATPNQEEQVEEDVQQEELEEAVEAVEEDSSEAEVEAAETVEEPAAPVQEVAEEIAPQSLVSPAQVAPAEGRVSFLVTSPNNMENYENTLEDFTNHPLILTSQETGETYELSVGPDEGNTSNRFRLEGNVDVFDGGTWFDITLPQELIDLGYSLSRDHQVRVYSGIVGSTTLSYNAPQDTSNTGELSRRNSDYGYTEGRNIAITLTSLDGSRTYTLGNRNLEMPSGEYTIRISNAPEDSRPELVLKESSLANAPQREISLEQAGNDYVGTATLDFSDSTRPQILEIAPAPLVTIEAPEVYDVATRDSRVEGMTPEDAEEIRVYLPGDTEEYRSANILSARPGTNDRAFSLALPEGYELPAGEDVQVTAVDANGNESEATVTTIVDADEVSQLTVDLIYPESETISGTVNPDATVQVVLPGNIQISAIVNADGTWSVNTLGNASALELGEAVDIRVRIDGNTHTFANEFFVEVAPAEPIELPRPEGLRHQRLPHGTTINAEDSVTNIEDFPEGTTFEFYDYATQTGTESITLDVAPNPESRNEYLVIRATHPDASNYADSFRFTVVIEAPAEAPISLENSSHILARLGFYGDRYYRNTITLVDELGRPVEGLTEADFNIDTFGGIVNFEADGNVYTLDTDQAGELRPDHSLSVDENGVIHVNIADEREGDIDLDQSSLILARLGFYGDRYYRTTISLVDEFGRAVEGLTEADFNMT